MSRITPSLILSVILLAGCVDAKPDMPPVQQPKKWAMDHDGLFRQAGAQDLQNWWLQFNDPSLTKLVDYALDGNPDRQIAQARILEERGLERSTFAGLFPHFGLSGEVGRENAAGYNDKEVGDLYNAGFDASWEIDIFGKNRDAAAAGQARLAASEAGYHDITLTLLADVARTYVDYCLAERHLQIAEENLEIQEKTLSILEDRNKSGDAPRLDVARAASLVDTTRASLPEFKRQAEDTILRLSVLTARPQDVIAATFVTPPARIAIPGGNIAPILMAPAQVLSLRPDIHQAALNLEASTDMADSTFAQLFPSFTLGGFFGINKYVGITPGSMWNVTLNTAMSLIDFGAIEGRVDASRAREKQAYESYRKSVIGAVAEVETALVDYSRIRERRMADEQAYKDARTAWDETRLLFASGIISFIDVLDSQRSLNQTEAALATAQADQTESLIRLYKALGMY